MSPPGPTSAQRLPPTEHDERAARKQLRALADQWSRETGGLSNPHKRLRHPCYRAIVAMSWQAVPFLLDELKASDDPELWGPALHEITGEQITLAPEDSGRPDAVARAWLALADARGWSAR